MSLLSLVLYRLLENGIPFRRSFPFIPCKSTGKRQMNLRQGRALRMFTYVL